MRGLHRIASLGLSAILVLSLSEQTLFRNVEAVAKGLTGVDMFPGLMDPTYSMLTEILASHVVSKHKEKEFRDLQSNALSTSDLTELNQFLEGLIIKLPDQDSYPQINISSLPNSNIATKSFSLREINIGRITDQQAPTIIEDIADDKYNYMVQLSGLDLVSVLDFEVDLGLPFEFLQLCGRLRVEVADVTAKFDIAFKSEDLDVYPPSYAELERCRLEINVELIKVDGDNVLFDIVNQFESLARSQVEDILDSALCNLIRDAVSGSITSALRGASNVVNPYTDPNFGQENDLIDSEVAAFQKAKNIDNTGIDFSNTNSPVGGIIDFLITLVDRFLSSEVEDTENTDGKSRDLGINTLLRGNVLDEDRKFVWEEEIVLYDNNTALDVKLTLERAEILGLDTFTSFEPLQAISQTLSSNFEIPSLRFDIILGVELGTGSNPENDALLMFIPKKFTDRISLSFEFTDIFLNTSAYIILEESKLENINLGSFLNTTNLLPCSLASMKEFRLDELTASIDINTPRMDRFIDEAIGALMNNIFDAISFMSDAILANALPRYLSTTGKQNITDIAKFAIQNITAEECPTFSSTPEAFIDFRDLLLEEDVAREAGASGTLPYGDVCPFVKKIIDENFVLPREDGSPIINNLVANATAGQSGTEGTIKVNQTIDLALCLPDLSANFGLKEVIIENLDTFDYPFEIFTPTDQNVLSNRFVLGSETRPLRLGVRFETSINATSRDLNEKNEFYLTIDTKKFEIVFAVIAKFYEESFMQFPVNNMANVDCWLASLPDFKGTNERALGIDELELAFEDLIIDLDCIECGSQRDLPAVLDILKGLDGFDVAARSLITFAKEFVLSIGNQDAINEMIHNAPKKCPHHPAFEGTVDDAARPFVSLLAIAASGVASLGQQEGESSEEVVEEEQGPICIGLPTSSGNEINLPFSRDAHESLIFLTLLVVEMVLVTLSLSTVKTVDFTPSNLLEVQDSLSTMKTDSLLDFSNLNATFLNWLDGPLKSANATVSNLIDDPTHENGKDIGANVYIRRVLSEDGSLTVPINFELNSTAVNMPLSVNYVKLTGLDSFTKVVLMKTIAPQTLQSEFELESLDIELSLSITSPNTQPRSADFISTSMDANTITENITISFGLKDIGFDLGLFLGLGEEAFRTFNLGSVFDTNQLISCLVTVVDDVHITRLLMSIGSVKSLGIEGFLSDELKDVVLNFQSLLFDSFESDILAAVPILSDGLLKEIANGAIRSFLSNVSACNLFQQASGDGFVDFRDLFLPPAISLALGGSGTQPYGNIWSTIYGLVKTFLLDPNENGVPKIGDILIGPLTSGQSNETGTLFFKNPVVDSSFDLSRRFRSEGFLNLTALYDTTIKGLDGINNPLVLLAPVGAHVLNNSFSFGSNLKPVEISTSANLSVVDQDGFATTNTFDISLAFPKIGLKALLMAKIDEKAFMGFPFEDVVNVDCWIASLPSRELDEFGLAIEGENVFAGIDDIEIILEQSTIEITCRQCDDPELQYYAEMFTGVSFAFFTQSFITSGAIQNIIDKSIFSAVRKCPHSPEYDPEFAQIEEEGPIFDRLDAPDSGFTSTTTFFILFASFGALFTVTYCAGYVVNRSTKRKHAMWLATLSDNEILTLYMEHNHEREQQKEVSKMTSSMFTSPEIPVFIRYSTPLIVLINIGLFVSGHLNLGATIDVTFFFAGQPFSIEGLYTYAILTLVEDMWKNAIKALAVVVFIASVLWPYTKQVNSSYQFTKCYWIFYIFVEVLTIVPNSWPSDFNFFVVVCSAIPSICSTTWCHL